MTVQEVKESIKNQTQSKKQTNEDDHTSILKLFGNMALINEAFNLYCEEFNDMYEYIK